MEHVPCHPNGASNCGKFVNIYIYIYVCVCVCLCVCVRARFRNCDCVYGCGSQQVSVILKTFIPFLFPWRNSPPAGQGLPIIDASLSHLVRHTTLGMTSLDEGSASLRNNTQRCTRDKHPCPRPNSNPKSQLASHRILFCCFIKMSQIAAQDGSNNQYWVLDDPVLRCLFLPTEAHSLPPLSPTT